MDATAYLTTLRADAERLAVAAERDLSARVPACPEWSVHDLVVHLGRVHRWVEGMVRARATERAQFPPRPDEGTDVLAWFRQGADQLVEALGAVDPDEKVWNWGDGLARFWHRRQAQETAVHRWDVQHAFGDEQPIDAALAVDGIDEILAMLAAGPGRKAQGNGETIHLHTTDREGEWTITFAPDGLQIEATHGKGDAAVRGTASDVLLFAWNRIAADAEGIETFGNPALLERWRNDFAL